MKLDYGKYIQWHKYVHSDEAIEEVSYKKELH